MVWNLVEAIKHENLNFEFKFESLFSWSTPTVLSNTGMFEFEKFLRGSDFCQNRKGLVNGGVVIKRWRRSIFTLTNSFQCYFFWVFGVCVCIVSSPPGISGGDDLCVISQAGGQLLSFKSQSGDTFRGKMILGSQAGGELLYHDELLVFPQNALPWILQISPAALS